MEVVNTFIRDFMGHQTEVANFSLFPLSGREGLEKNENGSFFLLVRKRSWRGGENIGI